MAILGDRYSPTQYTPNLPDSIQRAIEPYKEDYQAVWSDDGNSLTIIPGSVASSGISSAVYNGNDLSSYDVLYSVKQKAQNFYQDIGVSSPSDWLKGLSNAQYDPEVLSLEKSVINQYLTGAYSAEQAANSIANIRTMSLKGYVRVIYDDKGDEVGRQDVPIKMATPIYTNTPVSSSSPNAQNIIDLSPLKSSIDEIVKKMPDPDKIDSLNEAQKEALDYEKTVFPLVLVDGEGQTLISPRDAEFLSNAQNQRTKTDINNERYDDVDFALTDLFMKHLPFVGVSSAMGAASDSFGGVSDLPDDLFNSGLLGSILSDLSLIDES